MDLNKLKDPMEYQWKQQTKTGLCVAYIDARQVQDKLDEVCGPENWQNEFRQVNGHLHGGVGIKIGEEWVWKWDVGIPSEMDPTKGEASGAFKRAAVHWGVGRFLYDVESVRLKTKEYKGKSRVCDDGMNILWDKKALSALCNLKAKEAPKEESESESKDEEETCQFPSEDEKMGISEVSALLATEFDVVTDDQKVKELLWKHGKKYPTRETAGKAAAWLKRKGVTADNVKKVA